MLSIQEASPDHQDHQSSHLPNGYENEEIKHLLLLNQLLSHLLSQLSNHSLSHSLIHH